MEVFYNSMFQFAKDCQECIGGEEVSALYDFMVKCKDDKKLLKKCFESVERFCIANRYSIINFEIEKLYEAFISVNNHFKIHGKTILNGEYDEDVWKHLLKLSSVVDPNGGGKEKLLSLARGPSAEISDQVAHLRDDETEFATALQTLVGIIKEKKFDENADPIDIISNLLTNKNFITQIKILKNTAKDIPSVLRILQTSLKNSGTPSEEVDSWFGKISSILPILSSLGL